MLEYGPRLTEEEYSKAVVELYSHLPPVPTREQQASVRRKELDLEIDFRLGRSFPSARREKLWEVQQRIMGRQRRAIGQMLRGLVKRPRQRDADRTARWLVNAYRDVLSEREVEQFFDAEIARNPTLPVDKEPRARR